MSPIRVAVRGASALAVVALAAATLPAILLLTPAGRGRLLRFFARALLAAIGVRHALRGRLPRQGALIVANHVSWLDVVVLLAYAPARLLAKREVRSWPVVGALAAAAGTVFVDRFRPRALPGIVADVTAALRAGGVVAVFPEGTTWCGRTGGRFRPAMFQAAIDAGVPVAPVTLRFRLAGGAQTTVAAFIGDDTLLASLRRVLSARDLHVTAQAHPALHPCPGASRRTLARAAQSVVQGPAVSRSWTVDGPVAPASIDDRDTPELLTAA
ncbi:1-acyl-sn-glycerol-3-phosphate acyltransferase [Planosporangium flavigriseum]|uniref:1-acyl-sn-glycerol-3-phosphate acyltransferase n=1 Tax=Planosporangium flavigriseum TaxID=373681 RepID=A0A8J3LW13_9ACTN|nr:1-acyl-sn-glycerol-3-phosphate acyltransferase [Planosporangium flavigriseum]